MAGEKSQFTSDRRVPSTSSWTDDGDWAAGVAEGVDVVDDGLIGRPPNQHSELPDSAVYLHDDWEDNSLSEREDSGTTTHNGVEGVYRPGWTIDSGDPNVQDGEAVFDIGDTAYTEIDLNLDETITWELTNFDNSASSTGYRSHVHVPILSQTNTVGTCNGMGSSLHESYAVHRRKRNNRFRLIRTDPDGSSTVLLSRDVAGNIDVTVTRSPDGLWELFYDGNSVGTATDMTYTNANYVGLHCHNENGPHFALDEFKVY